MLLYRQKSRAGANPESPPITQPGINIHEVRVSSRTVFRQEQNELSLQLVVQYYQVEEGDEFHYHVLGLNETSTENDMKKPIVPWIVDFTLKKSIQNFLMWYK